MIYKKCDWCSDDTCSDYWRVILYGKELHRICNCCYEHLRKETQEEREYMKKL